MAREMKSPRSRDRGEKFQSFSRPKVKVIKTTASGKTFVDYKDTETLRRMMSANGKILSRRRTGISAMDQRMLTRAVKRARFMALLPYVSTAL